MKKKDVIVLLCVAAVVAVFFVFPAVYEFYKGFNARHGLTMSFLKFALLSTFGECVGLRITHGVYSMPGFGIAPRALVWGVLGVGISMAMTVFAAGVPALARVARHGRRPRVDGGGAFLVKSVRRVLYLRGHEYHFAPLFMTMHKLTDTHILATGGTLRGFFTPMHMGDLLAGLNWHRQWDFVFKKTIPLFWYPAHTITFLLPGDARVLFAALLGVALGVLLAIAAHKK